MTKIKVLMITGEWPDAQRPAAVPFLVREVELLRARGIDLDVFYFRGSKNPLNYLRATLHIRKKLRQKAYDLVHAQWGQSGLPVLFTSLPLVTTFRGSDVFGIVNKNGKYTWAGRILTLVSKIVALRSNVVIVVSKRMLQFLPRHQNIQTITVGINLELFSPGKRKLQGKG